MKVQPRCHASGGCSTSAGYLCGITKTTPKSEVYCREHAKKLNPEMPLISIAFFVRTHGRLPDGAYTLPGEVRP